MRDVLHALLALQEVDRDLYRVQEELKRLPQERSSRQAEIDKAVARIADTKKRAQALRVRIKELEDGTAERRTRIRKVESEAAHARADAALQAHFEHQARTLKREIGTAEDEALGLMEQAETLDKEVVDLQKKLDTDSKVFAEFNSNVERELADAEARRAKLADERKKRTRDGMPPEALTTYSQLLAARQGVALAALEGRTCQACFMDIPTNMVVRVARGTELVQCPSCHRILFAQG